MRNINKIITVLLVLVALHVQAQKRVKVDGVAAVVGEFIILDSDIDKFRLEMSQENEDSSKLSDCEILNTVLEQKLLAHYAEIDTTLVVNEDKVKDEVKQKLSYLKQQLGGEKALLKFYGFDNEEDIEEEMVKVQKENDLIGMMQNKVLSDVQVTPEEVNNFYESLKAENKLPEFPTEIKIAQIVKHVNPSEEEVERVIKLLRKLKKEIEEGANMKLKAIRYSDDPAVTQNGGMYKITRNSPFIKEFKEMAFSLDEGEVSDPFKTDFGYHILKVEKIHGQELQVRHILIQPEIKLEEKEAVRQKLDSIKHKIEAGELSFEEAVKKYSDDKETKMNGGILMNPFTGESTFKLSGEELMQAFPAVHSHVYNLEKGQLSDVFYDETREGEKMYKLLLMKDKSEAHTADIKRDYIKIQKLALKKKKAEAMDEWMKEHVKDAFIKIDEKYRNCEFKYNYLKK